MSSAGVVGCLLGTTMINFAVTRQELIADYNRIYEIVNRTLCADALADVSYKDDFRYYNLTLGLGIAFIVLGIMQCALDCSCFRKK